MSRVLFMVLVFGVFPLASTSAVAQSAVAQSPPTYGERLLQKALPLEGVDYDLGGRLQATTANGKRTQRGTDCQGVLFYAFERLTGCGWRSYSVMPTKTAKNGELGKPVPGLTPVATGDLPHKLTQLQKGDVVFLLSSVENPAEPSLVDVNGEAQWVWHTAFYAGADPKGGRIFHADVFTGEVRFDVLVPYLTAHDYSGIYVLRPSAQSRPRRCRRRKMPAPKGSSTAFSSRAVPKP